MDLETIVKMIQGCLVDSPLIILGSGASVPYGLPTMEQLGKEIKNNKAILSDSKSATLIESINQKGLEVAIDENDVSSNMKNQIRQITWEYINAYDLQLFKEKEFEQLLDPLIKLIRKAITPSPNQMTIVTTNYDRLAEYACDLYAATIVNGFEGNLLRTFDGFSRHVNIQRVRSRERVVKILKVHGSLDWFIRDGKIFSIPLTEKIPEKCCPLIIPPGKDKYSNTHAEPYRTIIAEADTEFKRAKSFLCIGYGFNDAHIQPILLEQVNGGKPIVVITKAVTEACRKLIIDASLQRNIVLEAGDNDNSTNVYFNGKCSIIDRNIWALENFMEVW